MKIKVYVAALMLSSLIACNKETVPQSTIDNDIIKQYIADNEIDAKALATGLHYSINEEGTGSQPDITSTVTVAYKGYLTDGFVFDQSSPDGIEFPLANVIRGWQEGIPLFKEGGSGVLIIPSALGYGTQGTNSIPKNAVLVFDVELIKVE